MTRPRPKSWYEANPGTPGQSFAPGGRGRGMAWSAFNDHLSNMSDEDLGNRINKIKESGNPSWRWKPLYDRILSEWDNRQSTNPRQAVDVNYNPRDHPKIKEHLGQSLASWEERRGKAIDAQVKKWQLNPPKSPEGYPSPEVRGHHPTSGPMDVLKSSKRRQNTSRGVRSSSLKINSTLNL